jgi:Na+-transporting methylmalonyl-CoA/oxaloacetate decarboxylase gamma subunit
MSNDNKKNGGGIKILLLVLLMLILIVVIIGFAANQIFSEEMNQLGNTVQDMMGL